jgi:RNA-directed DNA polymerase
MEEITNINTIKSNYQVSAKRFLNLNSTYGFYHLLMIDPFRLNLHLNNPIYFKFEIPKKKGGVRKIEAPNDDLKAIQERLNYFLQTIYLSYKPHSVHGFILKPGETDLKYNIISNASVHVNKKYLLNLDIQDFFPSISAKQINEVLLSSPFNFHPEIATLVSLIGTYQKKLPTGSPCSPVLANMVCYKLDEDFEQFCSDNSINFTRYADDLSFSSDAYFSKEMIGEIKTILKKYNFLINEKKTRVQSSKSKQTVTGLVVNKKVNVDRKYIRKIRAILHHWKLNGINNAALRHFNGKYDSIKFASKIKGQIEFIGQVRGVNDLLFQKLKGQFANNLLDALL